MNIASIVSIIIINVTGITVVTGLISYIAFKARERRRKKAAIPDEQVVGQLEFFVEYRPQESQPVTGMLLLSHSPTAPIVLSAPLSERVTFYLLLLTILGLSGFIIYLDFFRIP